jgi:hypothetical protein
MIDESCTRKIKVEGKFLTDFLRQLYIAGSSEFLKITKKCCEKNDVKFGIIRSVCKGFLKISGSSGKGFEVVDDPESSIDDIENERMKNRGKMFTIYKTPIKSFYGWISPKGRVYHCDYGDHLDLSFEIASKVINVKYTTTPDDKLMDLGWISFRKGMVYARKSLTQKQVDSLYDHIIDVINDETCKYIVFNDKKFNITDMTSFFDYATS